MTPTNFMERFVPPIIGIFIMLPIWIIWWVSWTIVKILFSILVPFAYQDDLERKLMTSRFNPDGAERRRWIKYDL